MNQTNWTSGQIDFHILNLHTSNLGQMEELKLEDHNRDTYLIHPYFSKCVSTPVHLPERFRPMVQTASDSDLACFIKRK